MAGSFESASDTRNSGKYRWIFQTVWLLFLAYPISSALHLALVPKLASMALIAVFAATYVVVSRQIEPDSRVVPGPVQRTILLALATFTVEIAVLALFLKDSALSLLVFVLSLAVIHLPLRGSGAVAAACLAAVLVLPRVIPGWDNEDSLVVPLLLSGYIALGMVMMMRGMHSQTLAKEREALLSVAQERLRLGRDVHDILGHSLTVITIKAELAGRLFEIDPGRARAEIAELEALSRGALADIRSTVGAMRAVTFETELANAHEALATAGIAPVVQVDGPVRPESQELFGWVLREAVTNVIRHSGARSCTVRVSAKELAVEDDGHGAVAGSCDGSGLAGIRERCGAAGARFVIGQGQAGGIRIMVQA